MRQAPRRAKATARIIVTLCDDSNKVAAAENYTKFWMSFVLILAGPTVKFAVKGNFHQNQRFSR